MTPTPPSAGVAGVREAMEDAAHALNTHPHARERDALLGAIRTVEALAVKARNAAAIIRNCANAGQIGAGYAQHADDIDAALAALGGAAPAKEGEKRYTVDSVDVVRGLRALQPHLCARDFIALEDAALLIESLTANVRLACPECRAAALYECPACSATNYPITPAAPKGGECVEWDGAIRTMQEHLYLMTGERDRYKALREQAQEQVRALAARIAEANGGTDPLQSFKDYVHQRLDAMGVPVDPESPHKAAGCRIGGRLDWIEEQLPATPAGDGGLSLALRILEEHAVAGVTLQGDDVPRLHATVDRLAPSSGSDLREALRQIVRQTEKMAHDSCEDCYGAACIANGALARSEQPATPAGGAYDRELIARMLESAAGGTAYERDSVIEQIRLLREADNAEASRIGTVCTPAGGGDEDSLEAFQNAMERLYGYRPKVFVTGTLLNSRDADRYEGWLLARRLASERERESDQRSSPGSAPELDWRRLAAYIADAMKAEGWGVPHEEAELRADVEAAVQNGLNGIGVEATTGSAPAPSGKIKWPGEAKPAADGDGWVAISRRIEHRMSEDQARVWNGCRAACIAAAPTQEQQ